LAALEAKSGDGVPCGITTTFTLWRDLDCVDVEIAIRDKPADPWPEAGWLCLAR
jgi:hypothetical protein